MLTGTNLHESEQAQQLAQRYDRCWSTAGVHPHDSSQWTSESAQIIHRLAKEVVAIGECGLDFNRNFSTPAEQEKRLRRNLPRRPSLKCRCLCTVATRMSASSRCWLPWLDKLPGAVLHCFTGSRQEALDCLDRGLYLGITGWVCDERRGLELRELLPVIPADRLLFETDAPYLLPRDIKPKPASRRNEPACWGILLLRAWRSGAERIRTGYLRRRMTTCVACLALIFKLCGSQCFHAL